MDPDKYFSGHNLNYTGRKQKFGYVRQYAIRMRKFYLSPVADMTVDFKKMVSDLFRTGSTLVERECIKKKTRLSK